MVCGSCLDFLYLDKEVPTADCNICSMPIVVLVHSTKYSMVQFHGQVLLEIMYYWYEGQDIKNT